MVLIIIGLLVGIAIVLFVIGVSDSDELAFMAAILAVLVMILLIPFEYQIEHKAIEKYINKEIYADTVGFCIDNATGDTTYSIKINR